MSMHFLPEATVYREYEQRLVVRGEDLDTLLAILNVVPEAMLNEAEVRFVERVKEMMDPTDDADEDDVDQQDPFATFVA